MYLSVSGTLPPLSVSVRWLLWHYFVESGLKMVNMFPHTNTSMNMWKRGMKWLEISSPKKALLGMFVPSQSHCPVLLLSEIMVSSLQPTAKWFLAFKLSKEILSFLFLKPLNTAVHTIASNTTPWRACVGTGWGLPENDPFPAGT